jgi:hypothetical protein
MKDGMPSTTSRSTAKRLPPPWYATAAQRGIDDRRRSVLRSVGEVQITVTRERLDRALERRLHLPVGDVLDVHTLGDRARLAEHGELGDHAAAESLRGVEASRP